MKAAPRLKRDAAAKAAAKISRNVSKWDNESDGDGFERDDQSDEDAQSSEEYDDDSTADAPAPKRRKPQAKPKGKGAAAQKGRPAATAAGARERAPSDWTKSRKANSAAGVKPHAKASTKRSRDVFELHSESEDIGDGDARWPSAARKRRKQPPTPKEAATKAGGKKGRRGKNGFKADDGVWNKRFEQLQSYKEEHGNCNVHAKYETAAGIKLGRKSAPRARPRRSAAVKAAAKLSEDMSEEDSGSDGDSFALDEASSAGSEGESMEEEEYDSDSPVPRKQPSKSNRRRGGNQRAPQKAIERKGYDKRWNEKFEQLRAYNDERGNCNVPSTYAQNPQLGKWVSKQREKTKKDKLLDERKERLDELGFQWAVGSGFKANDELWNERLEQLRAYKEVHGDCNVPNRYTTADGTNLGDWVSKQRSRKGKLTDERIRRLEDIEFEWAVGKGSFKADDGLWNERHEQLRAYKAEQGGDCNVPRNYAQNPQLGAWVSWQRYLYKKGKLSDERKERLDEIGFCWSRRDALSYVSESDVEELASEEENNSDESSESADEDASPPSAGSEARARGNASDETPPREAEAVEWAETDYLQEEVVAKATGPGREQEGFGGDGHFSRLENEEVSLTHGNGAEVEEITPLAVEAREVVEEEASEERRVTLAVAPSIEADTENEDLPTETQPTEVENEALVASDAVVDDSGQLGRDSASDEMNLRTLPQEYYVALGASAAVAAGKQQSSSANGSQSKSFPTNSTPTQASTKQLKCTYNDVVPDQVSAPKDKPDGPLACKKSTTETRSPVVENEAPVDSNAIVDKLEQLGRDSASGIAQAMYTETTRTKDGDTGKQPLAEEDFAEEQVAAEEGSQGTDMRRSHYRALALVAVLLFLQSIVKLASICQVDGGKWRNGFHLRASDAAGKHDHDITAAIVVDSNDAGTGEGDVGSAGAPHDEEAAQESNGAVEDVANGQDDSGDVEEEEKFPLSSSTERERKDLSKAEMGCATELKSKERKEVAQEESSNESDESLEDEEVVGKEETTGEEEMAAEPGDTGAAKCASVSEEEAQTSARRVEVGAHDSNPKEELDTQVKLALEGGDLDEESVDKIEDEIEEAPEGTSSKQEEEEDGSMYVEGLASAATGDVPVPLSPSYHKMGIDLVPSEETSDDAVHHWTCSAINAETPSVHNFSTSKGGMGSSASDSSASNVTSGEIDDSSKPTLVRSIFAWISVSLVATVLVQCRAKNKVSDEIVEQLRQLNEKNAANDDLQLQLKAKDIAFVALLQRVAAKNELVEKLKAKDAELEEKMKLLDDNQSWFSEAQEIVEAKDAQIATLSDQLDDAAEVAQMWKSKCSRLEGEIAEMHERRNEGISELGEALDTTHGHQIRQRAEELLALVGQNSTDALEDRPREEDAKGSRMKAMSVVNNEAGEEKGNQTHAASQKSDGGEVGTPGATKTTDEDHSGSISSESLHERKEEKMPPKNHPRHRSGWSKGQL